MTLSIELSPEEEARLREQARQQGKDAESVAHTFVQAGLNASPAEANARDAFLRHLLEQGDIPYVPQGRLGPPPRLAVVQGEPVSETIVRERG